MDSLFKNFRGFFSQSSLNALTTVVAGAAQEANSGDLAISARARNFLNMGVMTLGMLHLLINEFPHLHNADTDPTTGEPVAPVPGAPFPGSIPSQPVQAAPPPPPSPAPAPTPAPVPATPAQADPATAAPAPFDPLAALGGAQPTA